MKKNGEGILRKEDGSLYKGYFLNDEFHGNGTLEIKGTNYVGQFKNGRYHGKGRLNLQGTNGSLFYQGSFKEGLFDLKGKIKYSNQDVYEGEF